MTRKLSRFSCHQLNCYCFVKPRLSQLFYQLPLHFPYSIELGSPAHIGPHSGAIDFLTPINSPVFAAASGRVIEVVKAYRLPKIIQWLSSYWITRFWRGRMNYISISHRLKNIEEFSFYAHLDKNSIRVKTGDYVKVGQQIAQTGWCGWMDKPHLHFVVYTEKVKQFPLETHESLEPKWQNQF